MKLIVSLLALATPCAAFVSPSTSAASRSSVRVAASFDPTVQPGVTNPVGFFDPLNICDDCDSEVFLWLRAAELKHGRVCMLATTGWLVNSAGIFWPGTFDGTHTWASLGSQPLHAWNMMTELRPSAPSEILLFAGTVEFWDEARTQRGGKHPAMGGYMGLQFDPLGSAKQYTPEKLRYQQNKELNNGRLAMLGAASFLAAAQIDGAVPFLPDIYEGPF